MVETNVSKAKVGDLENAQEDFEVGAMQPEGISDSKETEYLNPDFTKYFGYYQTIPELKAAIDAKATWTWGKGYEADEATTMLLDTIKGNGFDTFNSIIENGERVIELGGNFYAEKIRNEDKKLINLKPLDPSVIMRHANRQGIIIRFEQISKIEGKEPKKFTPDKIFYMARNRFADEIHGRGIAGKLKLIIDMKNEAMADQRKALHWNVIPRWKFKLKTDDTTEIAAYKAKQDAATGLGENIYEPFDVSESELISVAPNATLNPMAWIN
ncbi:hypothetical protein LCGC14_2976580, partial [marine sediment metagenome]